MAATPRNDMVLSRLPCSSDAVAAAALTMVDCAARVWVSRADSSCGGGGTWEGSRGTVIANFPNHSGERGWRPDYGKCGLENRHCWSSQSGR